MSTPVRARPSPATSSLSTVCGWDWKHSVSAIRVARPRPYHELMLLHQTEPDLASHIGLLWPGPLYHNGVAGPSGQKYVVWVCRDASISPLNVLCHIFPDQLDARANGIGT